MKSVITLAFCFFYLGFLQSQHFNIALFNKSFIECETTYDDLERLKIYKNGYTEKFLKDGQPYNGIAKSIFKKHDGEILEYVISSIEDGYPTQSLFYHPDGNLSREFNFKNGLPHGLHVMYFKNGKKYIEENYQNGKKHGTLRRWTEEGNIAREAFYQNDLPVFDEVYIKDDRC